jgi:hypothetical protein
MAFFDWGSKPITSTGFLPVSVGSTSTLYAELDSTMLGTVNFKTGQSMLVQATYIVGGDTNITWQIGTCASTALNAGIDEFYVKTPTGQSAQYVMQHVLEKDYRIRVRQFSTGNNGAAYISAVPMT